MRTLRQLYPQTAAVYRCELECCPECGGPLVACAYHNGSKTVQTLARVMRIAYQPKRCVDVECITHQQVLRSAEWLQVAPLHCTYGYDVIAHIGWQRQSHCLTFQGLHAALAGMVQISESQVQHLYHQRYLPLLACQERVRWDELRQVSTHQGLVLSLDGLAPEGGEPQLWLVRELQTGLTLRSGWLSRQDQATFENFLRPIAEQDLRITAILSDKQRGLLPAVATIFPQTKHAFCQAHYLNNLAEPVAEADQAMKVTLRQAVREEIGPQIRQEEVESPGVLTVTGLIPSPVAEEPSAGGAAAQASPDPMGEEREDIVEAFKRRIRYLLTLKGRPPLRLAGIEMAERLSEVADCLDTILAHASDPRLEQFRQGIRQALALIDTEYHDLRQAADWLLHIADLLDPEGKPPRSGAVVRQQLFDYLEVIGQESQDNPTRHAFALHLHKTTRNYEAGLFDTYDLPELPPTNNQRESEFRDLNRRLLSTTGQQGATKRFIQRAGAWELIPRPDSFAETVRVLAAVALADFRQERQRVNTHRSRFRMHTRSAKQARKQLRQLQERWLSLPPDQ